MSELLPSLQARSIEDGLLDYLATTFALADDDAQTALRDFLRDPDDGIFKGPYVRTRLPFAPSTGTPVELEGVPASFVPYGHQAAAFARLRSPEVGRPSPTLITTGTGSGKTESFLFPILDHVVRARREPDGGQGLKALILYPMNALANDQALRLARLLTDPAADNPLVGVRAALYTGQQGPQRTRITADSLITDRAVIRQSPPDILLTNYKMLDQLLLRHDDQQLWRLSADSLRYVVLDEFHTYDGAQGTDVAMLLRRLGLALKSHWTPRDTPGDDHTADEWRRPLGRIVPVGTSATLGDEGDPAAMLGFAETIFGEPFGPDAVVTESRLTLDEWLDGYVPPGLTPVTVTTTVAAEMTGAVDALGPAPDPGLLADTVLQSLWLGDEAVTPASVPAIRLAKAHPMVRALVEATASAIHLDELERALFPGEDPGVAAAAVRHAFLIDLVAALSHLRALHGRGFVSVETHLWIRELTRLDREASALPRFRWADDGGLADEAVETTDAFPAVYCRHCGRSGWGVQLAHTGLELAPDQTRVRADHSAHENRFRALLYAPGEAADFSSRGEGIEGLYWFDVEGRRLESQAPGSDDERFRDGRLLAVLTHAGQDADTLSADDRCPSCLQDDGIRFLGSAIATLLSVSLSTLFGAEGLDRAEKKALVFTDSVQDAAHRAGFVASRSHTLALRAVLREAATGGERSLPELVDAALDRAGHDPHRRYRLLPPDFADTDEFAEFWMQPAAAGRRARATVRRRLLFDVVLEFGLQSRIGRTLERTGSMSVTVDAGSAAALAGDARHAIRGDEAQALLDHPIDALSDVELVRWVRGVLEHVRLQGGIGHEWLDPFVREDGNRYRVWGGRRKDQGMPAFPKGRSTPAFPRVGGARPHREVLLDPVTDTQSWYARWTARAVHITPHHAARLVRALLARLAARGVLQAVNTDAGGTAYLLPADRVVVSITRDADLVDARHRLVCDLCRTAFSGSTTTVDQLDGAPCLLSRCTGALRRDELDPANYYRTLYASADIRVIIAREHTSLLDDATRIQLENSFRSSDEDPGAPNVLVATPTLEMGIDIGDLSTVFLSSLPRTVASYLQRVGRAGRLTGNALNLAFVTGRGETLPTLGDPLSMINGAVRPPATYLGAEEILQRQYLAHLMDRLARFPEDRLHPRTAGTAIGSADPGSFLGSLVELAETAADEHLDAFLRTFSGLQQSAVTALRSWATPTDGAGTSGLAATVHAAVRAWSSSRETLAHRRTGIMTALPDLEERAGHPAASDDDKRAFRTARAALRLVNHQLADTDTEYWIGVLEEYGLLPNYTLLDDSVALDVAMTWFDPDANEYTSESTTYNRGASNALREFVPGATFYARGFEIDVDAVDVGINGEAIRRWAFCPSCGYARDIAATGAAADIGACPRCGDPRLADLQQWLPVVELERASAEIRRDDARIGDQRDDRKRPGFSIVTAADIDPGSVAARWYAAGSEFGVQYVRRLTIRRLNIGPRATHAPSRSLAGVTLPTPLFRLCAECGRLDRSARANSAEEHRPWCSKRRDPGEDAVALALSRSLTTQGLVISVPHSVVLGDGFALPSLQAAVLMGLRDQFGGIPSHIGVETITVPGPHGSGVVDALLLHDLVPGGTGYLADLQEPGRMWSLLFGAWQRLSTCLCAGEGRLACHRCLLPFAAPHLVPQVSRESARRHLRDLLVGDRTDEPTGEQLWVIQDEAPAPTPSESHLELHFRAAFIELLKNLGATVKETPGPNGNIITGTVGGVRWKLDPQVLMHGCKPDFVLTSSPNVPQVAIFTDGFTFHATNAPTRNRVADDAAKRANLRAAGVHVLAITYPDVDRYVNHKTPPGPPWFSAQHAQMFMQQFDYNASSLHTLLGGPFAWLVSWIQQPASTPLGRLADALPFFLVGGPAEAQLGASDELAPVARALLRGDGWPSSSGDQASWWWRHGNLGAVVRWRGLHAIDVALVLDDRPEALESDGYRDDWQEWLRLADWFTLRSPSAHTQVLALSAIVGSAAPAVDLTYPVGWSAAIEETFGAGADLARTLARVGVAAPDLVGEEIGSGIVAEFVWSGPRIAVVFDARPGDAADLAAEGWRLLGPDAEAIKVAIADEEG